MFPITLYTGEVNKVLYKLLGVMHFLLIHLLDKEATHCFLHSSQLPHQRKACKFLKVQSIFSHVNSAIFFLLSEKKKGSTSYGQEQPEVQVSVLLILVVCLICFLFKN